jgi:hypothetical protein
MLFHESRVLFSALYEHIDFLVEGIHEFLPILDKSLYLAYFVARRNIVGVEILEKGRGRG